MLDILIRNGLVIDGTGSPGRLAEVAVRGDRIVEVGQTQSGEAKTVIDASGCVVAPGFIDMHSHADWSLPVQPTADSLVHQGITTAVVGQCGSSPVPLLEGTRGEMIAARATTEYTLPWDEWSTFGSYLDYLAQMGTSINVVPLVGQGTIRTAVMGYVADPPDDEQMKHMQSEVIEAMESGAFGISTGLIYPPGCYTTTEELIAVTQPIRERGGIYFSHIRGEGQTLLKAMAEAIQIGRDTGAAVHTAHFKAAGHDHWEKAALALELIDQARAQGLNVTADMYPYVASSTSLVTFLPEWAREGGKAAILGRLADPEACQEMTSDMQSSHYGRDVEWDKVLIAKSPRRCADEGRHVSELAARAGQSACAWVLSVLLETELDVSMIRFGMSEDNLRLQLRRPWMMIGTDGYGLAIEGPLSGGVPHQRSYGTFPRVLARYVREQKVISVEEAIRRMTGLPAQTLRLADRGLVRKGHRADLVIFDPNTVADRATYEAPHQYAAGIPHVIVNGKLVIHQGVHTQRRPGSVLRR